MRKVILGFGLVVLMMMVMNNSASAFSWTWHKLADNNGVKVYIAERSFKSNLLDIASEKVYQVEYWMKVSNGKAEAKSHLMGRINKETKEMYYKVIEGEEILADNTVVKSTATDWVKIEPNSAEEFILGEVLKYDLKRRTNEIKNQELEDQNERAPNNGSRNDGF
mgnify:CR=1 FL=1